MTYDPWQQTLDQHGGIEGLHLKCAKGTWKLDDFDLETGDNGLKVCVLMPTAKRGAVLWGEERTISEQRVGRYEAGFVEQKITSPWSPYTSFLGVCADKDHRGQLITFTSSSWGGRSAFEKLIGPYVGRGKTHFPVCTLGSKPMAHDPNGNIDPVFSIADWAPRGGFEELLPPPVNLLEAPHPAELPKPRTVDIIDDDIPF
jgi:hypothetical protein